MKAKHHFNIFDISVAVLTAVLILLHLVSYGALPEENGSVSYILSAKDMYGYAVKELEAGKDIYSTDGNVIGRIELIEAYKNAEISSAERDNSAELEYYGLYTVKIKITSEAVITKNSISANGQLISSGMNIAFTTNGVGASGICSDIEFSYYDGGQEQ